MRPKYLKFLCIFSGVYALVSVLHAQLVVTRGPYIQMVTQNSLFIRWRTNFPTDSKITYGTNPSSQTGIAYLGTVTTEHEVQVTGLNPDTKYYYSIGHSGQMISIAPDQFFYTLPLPNTIKPYTFWVVGDCGTADNNQRAVRDAYLQYIGNTRVDGMIMLGDNAYYSGTDNEFQGALFNNTYENIVSNLTMWPSPGNHDYYSGADAATQTGPYYDIFTLPSAGQLGGFPSGTEAYYSYEIGNIHFISLDSYDSGRDSTNAMGTWLKQDLMNNTKEWTIAYWHHPPYSKGNHDSDNPPPGVDPELPEMREQILPLIEKGGVDLVLCGHSHSYERSYLMDGHYGSSSTYNTSFRLDSGSGDFINDCPYTKNTLNGDAHQGTVYVVCGVSGKKSHPVAGWPHPVTYTASTDHLGSMILTINGNKLDAKFITSTDSIFDQFTIIKNAGVQQDLVVCDGSSITLTPSFFDDEYIWLPGNVHSSSFSIYPVDTVTYYSTDHLGCIEDTFNINVIFQGAPGDTCDWSIGLDNYANKLVNVFPNPIRPGDDLYIGVNSGHSDISAELMDPSGRVCIFQILHSENNSITIPAQLQAGAYILKLQMNNSFYIHKLILTN
jgi:acid phosphatase type 7